MSTMNEAMKAEKEDALATLQKANDLLMNMFNLSTDAVDEAEELAECTRCWRDVPEDELATYGEWKLCDICQGDI